VNAKITRDYAFAVASVEKFHWPDNGVWPGTPSPERAADIEHNEQIEPNDTRIVDSRSISNRQKTQ
jgi:hypothetical protein